MDKPLCRLCGKKHYSDEPHIFPYVDDNGDAGEISVGNKEFLDHIKPNEVKKPVRKWDRESWNAYMKEYMRKRRAK